MSESNLLLARVTVLCDKVASVAGEFVIVDPSLRPISQIDHFADASKMVLTCNFAAFSLLDIAPFHGEPPLRLSYVEAQRRQAPRGSQKATPLSQRILRTWCGRRGDRRHLWVFPRRPTEIRHVEHIRTGSFLVGSSIPHNGNVCSYSPFNTQATASDQGRSRLRPFPASVWPLARVSIWVASETSFRVCRGHS